MPLSTKVATNSHQQSGRHLTLTLSRELVPALAPADRICHLMAAISQLIISWYGSASCRHYPDISGLLSPHRCPACDLSAHPRKWIWTLLRRLAWRYRSIRSWFCLMSLYVIQDHLSGLKKKTSLIQSWNININLTSYDKGWTH